MLLVHLLGSFLCAVCMFCPREWRFSPTVQKHVSKILKKIRRRENKYQLQVYNTTEKAIVNHSIKFDGLKKLLSILNDASKLLTNEKHSLPQDCGGLSTEGMETTPHRSILYPSLTHTHTYIHILLRISEVPGNPEAAGVELRRQTHACTHLHLYLSCSYSNALKECSASLFLWAPRHAWTCMGFWVLTRPVQSGSVQTTKSETV